MKKLIIAVLFLACIYTEAMNMSFVQKAACHLPTVACFLAKAVPDYAPVLSTVPFIINGPSVLTQVIMFGINTACYFSAYKIIDQSKNKENAKKMYDALIKHVPHSVLKKIHFKNLQEPEKAVCMVSARYINPSIAIICLYSSQIVALWYQKRLNVKNIALAFLYSGIHVGPWAGLIQFQEQEDDVF